MKSSKKGSGGYDKRDYRLGIAIQLHVAIEIGIRKDVERGSRLERFPLPRKILPIFVHPRIHCKGN